MGAQWSKHNNVFVFTTEAQYSPGEQVNGEVFVNIVAPICFSEFFIEISGTEFASYTTKSEDEIEGKVEADRVIFVLRRNLHSASNGKMTQGKYRFPFCFVLPPQLPGSCNVIGSITPGSLSYTAAVRYEVKASFEKCLIPTPPPLKGASVASEGLKKSEGERMPTPTPIHLEFTKTIVVLESVHGSLCTRANVVVPVKPKFMCWKPQLVNACIEAQSFNLTQGGKAQLTISLENATKQPVRDAEAALVRKVIFRLPDSKSVDFSHICKSTNVEDIPIQNSKSKTKMATDEVLIEMDVPLETQQSVGARYFDISYALEFRGHVGPHVLRMETPVHVHILAQTQALHMKTLKAPIGWSSEIEPTTDLALLQVEGSAQPNVGEFQSIGYVIPPK